MENLIVNVMKLIKILLVLTCTIINQGIYLYKLRYGILSYDNDSFNKMSNTPLLRFTLILMKLFTEKKSKD